MREFDSTVALVISATFAVILIYLLANNSKQITQILNQVGTSGNLDLTALGGN